MWKPSSFFETFFLIPETVTDISGKQFLKTELILLVENDFLASGNHFLPLTQIFLKEPFIPESGNPFFSPKEKVLFFILSFPWNPLFKL